ncbi:hypothetical protein ACJX0J_003099 [Zea mays]
MDFFLLLIFDPEPEEVVFLCILSISYSFCSLENRTHDAPISLFHYEWYACDNNDKIFLILIFLTKNVISKDFVVILRIIEQIQSNRIQNFEIRKLSNKT